MLKQLLIGCTALASVVLVASAPTTAQDVKSVALPADSKLVARIDIEAMQKSGFGQKLIELVSDRVMEEIADRFGIAVPTSEDVTGFVGFDPMTETRSITISATDFEKPENGLVGVIAMKKTIGSVEAMLPSLPGYSVKSVGDVKVHSASPNGDRQIHLAVHTCPEGMKTLVVGSSEQAVIDQLARIDGKTTADQKNFDFKPCPGAMIDVHVLEIPADRLGDGPQTVIATMVKHITFHLIDDSSKLNVSFDLTAVDGENAEQLDQMLQGIVPMLEGQVAGMVEGLQVKRAEDTVSLTAAMDSNEAANLLSSQFDSAVGMLEGLLGNQ